MKKNSEINVRGVDITVSHANEMDYLSLTDIAKSKEGDGRAADIIKNWIRNRGTIEFIGTWEQLHNPGFKVVEFDHFRMSEGNMRDKADVTQLVCLSNLENLNALFIAEGLPQQERLKRLNKIAIHQMTLLSGSEQLRLSGGGK